MLGVYSTTYFTYPILVNIILNSSRAIYLINNYNLLVLGTF
jgi:hypothetical protein